MGYKKYEIIICGLNTLPSSVQFKKHSVWPLFKCMQNCQKKRKWKCYTKDNWLASILATWGLGPHSSSSPFTPGLQSSPPRKGNWSTLRFGNSYLEFGLWATTKTKQSRHFPYLFVCLFPIYLSHQIPESQARPPDVMRQKLQGILDNCHWRRWRRQCKFFWPV